ncbi:s-acyltransferase [Anaeramoeba flamelloides]|uniref:Palmitoyltransferase n=1 Tax=Anaeramoeba flamelloides TaxID=1746091 RepID=A0AAV7YKP1_9EUKA|nr:s-acyltransferase [Anaeramoeba flamelloides]
MNDQIDENFEIKIETPKPSCKLGCLRCYFHQEVLRCGRIDFQPDYCISVFLLACVIGFCTFGYVGVMANINHRIISFFCLMIFSVLLILFLISYFQTFFTDPGTVPMDWGLNENQKELERRFESSDSFDVSYESSSSESDSQERNEILQRMKRRKRYKKMQTKRRAFSLQQKQRRRILDKDPRICLPELGMGGDDEKRFAKNDLEEREPIVHLQVNKYDVEKKDENQSRPIALSTYPLTNYEHRIAKRRPKPIRAKYIKRHHGVVLKADHVCPWVSNVVGFRNYKFFFLVLFYCEVLTLFVTVTLAPIAIKGYGIDRFDLRVYSVISSVLALCFFLSTLPLFLFHLSLIKKNETTMEHYEYWEEANLINVFDLGKKQNWIQVFGENKKLWFVPVFTTPGDGYHFPTNLLNEKKSQIINI